jgi:RNA polymerase-associated protein CTR9
MDHYWRVLLKNPANMYAANGLGIILAERNELNEAKDFFIKVREATTTMPDVWLNLGHVYLAQGEFVNAIKMYQNCLRKFFGNKDPEVMLFLAKAYFEYGHMQECKQVCNIPHIVA